MHPDWQTFLLQQGALLSDGASAGFGDQGAERSALQGGTVLCDLSHEGLILASGDDAAAFLHGQFTNDVQGLSDGDAQLNGYCSPKGRLLATFLLWHAKQGYLLQLPRELVEPTRKRLSMFVLRAKVKLEDVSDQWTRAGVAGPQAESLLRGHFGGVPDRNMSTWHGGEAGKGVRIVRLSAQRFEMIGGLAVMQAAWTALANTAGVAKAGRHAWDWLGIRAGLATVVPATQDAFVPQMVNFELVGGVSFRKGCYPGQEIVARTQYRGILKRRMALAHVDGSDAPQPGEPVYSADFGDQAAGQVVNAAPAPAGGFDILVMAQIESLRKDNLTWKTPGGPALILQSLPYAVPFSESEELQRA